MVRELPIPHSPPMATPNRARNTRKLARVGARPDNSSKMEKLSMLIISSGRRP